MHELKNKIEHAYHKIGIPLRVDMNDQVYFLSALYSIVKETQLARVVQSGTYVGSSTLAIVLAMMDCNIAGKIETIDPEPQLYGGNDVVSNPVDYAKQVISGNKFDEFIVFHKGYSIDNWDKGRLKFENDEFVNKGILYELGKKKIYDMLIVDGDHTYEGTFWDMEVGFRALRPDGPRLIVVHDYSGIDSVRSAVKDWKKQYDNMIYFRGYNKRNGFALIQCKEELIRNKTII